MSFPSGRRCPPQVSDSFSILGEYGIDVRLVKFDQQGYEKKILVFDERIRGYALTRMEE